MAWLPFQKDTFVWPNQAITQLILLFSDVADGSGPGDVNDPVKKLPTIGRTIDRSRKYRPMENLSETPIKRKSGLDRLKQMKNDMFGGKKEQKEEQEMQQQVRPIHIVREELLYMSIIFYSI